MKTIDCWKCGKQVSFKGGNNKYCDDCKRKARIRSKRFYRERKRYMSPHFCVNCGRIIPNYNGHGQKYCRSCSEIVRNEKNRLYFNNYYARWKHVLPPSIGTISFSAHSKDSIDDNDFTDEFLAVRRENVWG